jgi:uncharacterized OB-fold protein
MDYKLTFKDYADALTKGKLLGLKCNSCGKITVPPKMAWNEVPYVIALVELEEGAWIMGNLIDIDPSKATMDLIGKEVKVGFRVFPGDKYSPGNQPRPLFSFA